MLRGADVMVENFAPGAMERLGVGPDVLMDANRRLIYASGTGYGLTGPDKDNLAMDLTVQAVGGVMGINGPADGPPLKTGLAICDFLGGVHLYSGIMTALYERSVTGQGRLVEIAMQEALYPALASNVASMHNNGWKQPERRGNRHPTRGSAPYNVYECVDGHVAIICVTEVHWTNLLDVVGRSELADDPRFATQALRAQHEDDVDAAVAPWLRERSKYEVAATLKENRVPAAPVRDLLEVTADAHMHERGMLHYVEHPEMGKVVLPSSPLRFAGSTPPGLLLEPDIGQHTDAILSDWLGMEEISVAALKVDGVVG